MIKILLMITVIEGLVIAPLQIGCNLDEDIYGILFAVVNFFILLFVLAREHLPIWLYKSIFVIYSIKILLLIFLYFNIEVVMNALSIRDVYAFFQPQALAYMHGDMDVQPYSKIVAYIYTIFGPFMRIPVFYNIEAALLADVFFFKTLMEARLSTAYIKLFSIVFMLLPWRNILSMFMVRESFPTFLVVLATYFFIRWWNQKKGKNFMYAIISSILSMAFHSGLVAVPVVMMLAYILFDPVKKQWIFNLKTVYKFGIIAALVGGVLITSADTILYKFTLAFSGDEALSGWSDTLINGAESNYLSTLSYTSFNDIILQSPLRMIYFILSPMPWDWRGLSDLIAFGMDSSVHLFGIGIILNNMSQVSDQNKKLIKVIFGMYILLALIFGAGTFDAGTAMRHRGKFTSLLLFAVAICIADRNQNKGRLQSVLER